MPFAKTHNYVTDGIETLDLETSFRHDHNQVEYVRIAVVPEDAKGESGIISFVLVQFQEGGQCHSLQACLLESEIDVVIDGLQAARARLRAINAPGEDERDSGELCMRCGRRYSTVWQADDRLWKLVTGRSDGGGLVCPNCFDSAARRAGHSVYWHCSLDGFEGRHAERSG